MCRTQVNCEEIFILKIKLFLTINKIHTNRDDLHMELMAAYLTLEAKKTNPQISRFVLNDNQINLPPIVL